MSTQPVGAGDAGPVAPETAWSLDTLAERLAAARRGGERPTAERVQSAVATADAAYRVQGLVEALLWPGVEATVWKAGADSRESLPTAAPIYPALVHPGGAALPAAQFPVCIVEAEIAYRFGVDLPPRTLPYTNDEVADAVAAMHVGLEIVTPRIVDFGNASSFAKLADHGVNGAFVLGDGIDAWRKVDLRKQKATLSIDGRLVEAVTGSHALGNPAVLLPWFVAHLGRLSTRSADGLDGPPRGVRAGDVVTTGSWTKVVEARAGQAVEVRFDGIGSAAVSFLP